MPIRLSDRLGAARQYYFVGRAQEQALFRSTITAEQLPFNVLYIYGPGGIGKTSLLKTYGEICHQIRIFALHPPRRLQPSYSTCHSAPIADI